MAMLPDVETRKEMMKTYRKAICKYGKTYSAILMENTLACDESVYVETDMGMREIYSVSFPTSNLGNASRDSYLSVMLSTISEKHAKT